MHDVVDRQDVRSAAGETAHQQQPTVGRLRSRRGAEDGDSRSAVRKTGAGGKAEDGGPARERGRRHGRATSGRAKLERRLVPVTAAERPDVVAEVGGKPERTTDEQHDEGRGRRSGSEELARVEHPLTSIALCLPGLTRTIV
jgi:hypothetical protein